MRQTHPEYLSFNELLKHHKEGSDFKREINLVDGARVAIIAPHGGRIEPYTDSIAKEIAGTDFSFYCFSSILREHEANLHITSHRFNDEECVKLIKKHEFVVAVHGWGRKGQAILVGGLDKELAGKFIEAAISLDIETHTHSEGLTGAHPMNICNRGKLHRGIQLELTMELRKSDKLQVLIKSFRDVLMKCQKAV